MYPRRLFHSSVSFATSRPSNPAACPPSVSSSPVSIRIVVDLPDPFGPRKPNTFPCGISKETPSTAVNDPNLRVRFSQRRRMSEEEEKRKRKNFLEGEEGGGGGGAGRVGSSLMRPPLRTRLPSLKQNERVLEAWAATRRILFAGTAPLRASTTLPSKKSSRLLLFPSSPLSRAHGAASRTGRCRPARAWCRGAVAPRRARPSRSRRAAAVSGEDLVARAGATSRPSSRKARRVAYSASSMYGVETTIVSPSPWSAFRTCQNSRRDTGSTPVVGSSRRRSAGRVRRAATSASFCFMPPESAPARREPKRSRPTRRRRSAARAPPSAGGTDRAAPEARGSRRR